MSRKYLNTLVAVVLLAAIWAAFTYYDRRQSRQAAKTETSTAEKILPLDSQHIQAITLKPRDGEAVSCRREGSTWAIVEPKKLAADQSVLSSLVNSLTTATADEVVEPRATNLKDFGLDPPTFTVEVSTDAKPTKLTLLLGDETPTSGGLYAQVAGNPRVVTLASYLKSSLEKNLFDLRDRRALTLDADQLQRIEAESKGKKWTLEKNPEGVWDLVLPPAVRADRFAVEGLVSQLRGLTMQSIVAEEKQNAGQYGFGAPQLRLQLSGSGGTQTLVLGKKTDGKNNDRYYAMNSAVQPIFTLTSTFLTQFQKDPADLREKDLFTFSTFEVKRLEVETPKGQRVFDKQKDKWKQTSGAAKDEATPKVEALLNALRDLRANSFPKPANLAQFGLVKPGYRFKMQFGERNQTEIVEASKVGGHAYARRPTDPLPCELSKAALNDIEKALNDL